MELLNIGENAPDFETIDQTGSRITLSQYKGTPVVLYFYAKDNTPGCTTEACSFRDNFPEFERRGIKVIGISVDSSDSHKKFVEKYNLNFTLASDRSKEICKKYHTLGLATAKRVTYIIDGNGKIAYVYQKVTPKDHAKEVLNKLKDLQLIAE
ncbi:MAG: peroxiredoxin [Thermoplasmata archaeon]